MSSVYSHYKGLYVSNTQISQSSIRISGGEIVPYDASWDLTIGYKNVSEKLISIEANKSLYGRIDTIIAKPNICEINDGFAAIDFVIIAGTPGENPIPNSEIGSPSMFIGWVYVPPQFPTNPSILCTRSFNQSIDSIQKTEYPTVVLKNILSTVEEWSPNTTYFYGQLVKSSNSIFICLLSHGSSDTLQLDIQKNRWQEITADAQDLSAIIQQILIRLLPDYIKHPSQPEFSIQFNVQNEFNGSEKLKWNTQFSQIELNGGLMLKNQTNVMQIPTDGINIYCKSYGISPSKHVEGVIVDEFGTQRTLFTLKT